MTRFKKLISGSALFSGAMIASSCFANDVWESVQIRGFVSQGYVDSSGANYPFEAKDGTFRFREMAVNASYATGKLRIGAQGYAQSLGNYGNDDPILDWAVVDYNVRREFGVRAGRVKFAKGLYGEALDVDFIRPFIFLPMGIYNPILRDFNSSFDGAMAYGNVDAGDAGSFDYKVFYGGIDMSPDQGVADFFNSTGIYASSGISSLAMESVVGGQLFWNTPIDGLRAGYSYSSFQDLAAIGPFAFYPLADAELHFAEFPYHIASVEYLYGDWTLAAEYQYNSALGTIRNPAGESMAKSKEAVWYVSAAWRLATRWELGGYYCNTENAEAGVPDATDYLRDWALSLRFDATDNLTLKLENHWIDGTYRLFNTPRTPNPAPAESHRFFAAKATYNF